MIVDQDPKQYFDKIVDAEPGNRTWVLSVVINFILGIACIVIFFVMDGAKSRAEKLETSARRELAIERATSLQDGKDCNEAIKDAVEKRDLYWQSKVDGQRDNFDTKLHDLELRMLRLSKEAKTIKTRVGI